MGKFLLIFCEVLLFVLIQGLLTKRTGTETLMKDFIDELIQQHGYTNTKGTTYTAVSEEVSNVGDDDAKDVFINGLRSFVKASRLRHADLGIVKRSNHGTDDLHSRGVNNKEPDVIIRPIPQLPLVTTAASATTTRATTVTPIPQMALSVTTAAAAITAAKTTTTTETVAASTKTKAVSITTAATTETAVPPPPPTTTTTAAATTETTTPIPNIKMPKIDICKLLFFICKSNVRKGWLFGRLRVFQ